MGGEPHVEKRAVGAPAWRPNWDDYFLKLAMLASERATCPRMHCGCVLVKDNHVLSTGYNGSLPGTPHCYDAGCLVVDNHCVRTNHAEINAICQAARHGQALAGATAYVTNLPCTACAKALIAVGFVRVVIFSDYHDSLAEQFFRESGVVLDRLKMPSAEIHYDLAAFSSARPFAEDHGCADEGCSCQGHES
ncbi:MAG: cytidine/deoxycytidylate deaminase family protein [Victivallales bacterium]|nr:cytidine/deoxycytidylate deaminase family protein [Victivallales bacterium]